MKPRTTGWLLARYKRQAKALLGRVRAIRYAGTRRYCPICDRTFGRFLPGGRIRREEAFCPRCGSAERHRLMWLYLHRVTDLFTAPHRLLHIAPELFFEREFAKDPTLDYVSGDLSGYGSMRLDVTDLPFADASFDVILCSHVLEHVPDDRKALRELRRVLSASGWAILQVPITAESTFEDLAVTDPRERLARFGQEDHVRRYGPDYADRLRESGFDVREDTFAAELDADTVERMRLDPNEILFVVKPGA